MLILYTVDNQEITIQSDRNEITITKDEFQKLFRVGYAFTIHACQGMRIETSYTIWKWELLNKKLKYVALSRATKKETYKYYISIYYIMDFGPGHCGRATDTSRFGLNRFNK